MQYRALYSYTTNFALLIEADSREEAEAKAAVQDGIEVDEYSNGSRLVELMLMTDEELKTFREEELG